MADKLNIQTEMRAYDLKDRDFYDSLTEEEVKKFSPYLMLRYGASVEGSGELQAWYLMATNERVNANFFDISTTKHKKLQWLMATTVSPGLGNFRHNWIAPRKKEPGAGSMRKQLMELFPHLKDDEIDLLSEITTKKEIDAHLRELGQDKSK